MAGFLGYQFDFDGDVIAGITDFDMPLGQEVMADPVAGSPYAKHKAINKQRPRLNLTSFDAAAILALCVPNGAATADDVIFWQAALDDLGVVKSGNHHVKHVFNGGGNLLCRKQSCDHQGDLSSELEYLPLWNGTDALITTTASQAAPVHGGDPARFGLGAVRLGNVVIPEVTKVEIDYGLAADTIGSGGAIWDNEYELTEVKPVITITSRAVNLFGGSLPLASLAGAHSNTILYFRKRSQVISGYIADATAEHIKLTAAGMVYVENAHKSSGNKRAETTIKVVCTHDGTNNPIIVDAASAIT